jgi:hypothetical protein
MRMANQFYYGRKSHETTTHAPVMQSLITCRASRGQIRSNLSEADMVPQSVIYLFSAVPSKSDCRFTHLVKRFGSERIPRALGNAPPIPETDPYLLLLLADQEMTEGREEQARYLVESAYDAFDRKAEANVYTLHPARGRY